MTAPRLIRLVPTGEVIDDIELVEPEEVRPLTEEQIEKIFMSLPSECDVKDFARAIEQAHGIGRRFDA